VPWLELAGDYARIRDLIEQVFDDFHDFNARVAVPGGFKLRNTASERVWATPRGKAGFFVHAVPRDTPVHRARAARRAGASPVFTLFTTRSHDQYNTTIYGMDDRYRGVFGQRRVVFILSEYIRALGMKDGDWVDLQTVWDDGQQRSAERFRLVAYDIPRGCIAAYYPETNPLVPLSATAIVAGTPSSKSIPVQLVAHKAPEPAGELPAEAEMAA
jgi:anaerobic selenocysteine-containing dehydrogenase